MDMLGKRKIVRADNIKNTIYNFLFKQFIFHYRVSIIFVFFKIFILMNQLYINIMIYY